MKILVTGAAGFIGYHLVKLLVKQSFNVIGIDNINDYYSQDLKYDRLLDCGISKNDISYNKPIKSSSNVNYTFVKLDIEDFANLNLLFESNKFDVIVNLAAQAGVRYSIENPMQYVKSNIEGFLNILEACKINGVKKILYASSSSVYGKTDKQPFSITDKVDTPVSMYAVTKKTNELMAHTYSHLFSLNTVGLRFFTVYGPWGRPDMAPILFAKSIVNDKPIKIFNNGDMERDFTYIDDIVKGIYQLIITITDDNLYSIFNIGNSKPIQLLDFIQTLEENFGKVAQKEMLGMQPGDLQKTWADTSELTLLTGYKPETDFKEGVKKFTDWYKNYY